MSQVHDHHIIVERFYYRFFDVITFSTMIYSTLVLPGFPAKHHSAPANLVSALTDIVSCKKTSSAAPLFVIFTASAATPIYRNVRAGVWRDVCVDIKCGRTELSNLHLNTAKPETNRFKLQVSTFKITSRMAVESNQKPPTAVTIIWRDFIEL
jgi:hypothetical protein